VPTVAGRLWHGHPVVSVLGGAVLYLIFLASGATDAIVALANVAAIVAMILVNAAAFQAARRKPEGALHLPLGPVLPALGLITAAMQFFFMGAVRLVIGLALVFGGSIVYWLKSHRHVGYEQELQHHLQHNNGPLGRALHRRA
jgi:basic amino acid/polyamine antiporter, APA family